MICRGRARSKPLARLLAGALVLLWLSGCGRGTAADSDEGSGEGGSAPSVQVQTMTLQKGSLPRTLTAYGVVQAEPAAQNSIVAPVAAQVTQVYVRSGQAVPAGAPLVMLDPTPPTQSAYAQAVSALKVTSETTQRTQQLLAQFLATEQQLADAQKAEGDARVALAALQAQGAGGPHQLRTPFDAIVISVSASVRSLVTEGSPLLELARPNGLVLTVGVAPDAAASIAAGDPVSVAPVGEGAAYAGRVTERGAIVQTDSGLVPVQIGLPLHKFIPGESAQATITVGSVSGYVVPHSAVLIDDNGNNYVVQAVTGTAKLVYVQVLGMQADRDVISGPLDLQAPLVLTGNYQAQNGMKLHIVNDAAAGAPAPASGQ